MTEISFDLLVALVSFGAGLIGALIGLGGGIIITPILVLAFGIEIHYAMGAALASVIATSSGAAAAYLRDGISNMRIGMFLCVATTIGAVIGALLATILNADVLSILFGSALLITALLSLRKQPGLNSEESSKSRLTEMFRLEGEFEKSDGTTVHYHAYHVIPGFLLMSIAGFLSGLLGIGSGAFKVLAMDQIMRIPFKVTTATSNFMIGVTAAASIGFYLKRGFLDPVLVYPVALGVLIGAFLGAKLLPIAPVKILKLVFLVAVLLIGIEMILRGTGINV